ncbi:MAG: diadenylate cyclase [Planctomycetota bacterium]|nr:diadenylate cyclase [Planctomycetota bacterium]
MAWTMDWLWWVEFSIVWTCVFATLEFLGRSRGAGVVKGVLFVGVVLALFAGVSDSFEDEFSRLHVLLTSLLSIVAVVGVAVFLPEIRQALVRLGESTLDIIDPDARRASSAAHAVSQAAQTLARQHVGAIIVIERAVSLDALSQAGVRIDAVLSARLLEALFWPGNPLHDLAVIVRADRIVAASVELPLADPGVHHGPLGSRHRASVGVTLDTDAVVVVVSEQTGSIRVAEKGVLSEPIPREELLALLSRALAEQPVSVQEVK